MPQITTPGAAELWLARVGVALRYRPAKGLPLASAYVAMAGPDPDREELIPAIRLTNHLLGSAVGIEVNVIAKRLTLVHRSLFPALYVLVRHGRRRDDLEGLSLIARQALALMTQRGEITAGDVRAHLGLATAPRNDPAYEALADLQRLLLVARGPFQPPKTGIPYLATEGYPYHLVHVRHRELVEAAADLTIERARTRWLARAVPKGTSPRLVTRMFPFLS